MTKVSAIVNIVRAGALSALMAGSVAMYSTNPVKTHKSENPPQTEVVSKEGAEAVKAMNFQQQKPTIPTVHNQKVDKTLMKFAEDEEDAKGFQNFIDRMYETHGTFLGTSVLQLQTDAQMLQAFIDGNTQLAIKNNINPELAKKIEGFGPAFYNTVTPHKEQVTEWIDSYMTTFANNILVFDHKPTAKEVNDRLDGMAENAYGFSKQELAEYYAYSLKFLNERSKNRTVNDTQVQSDLIAFKTYLLDRKIFSEALYGVGVFGLGSFENGYETIDDYYNQWIESVEPTTK